MAKKKPGKSDHKRAYQLLLAAVVLLLTTPYLAPRLSPEAALGIAAFVSLLAIVIIRSGTPSVDWFHPLSILVTLFFLLFVASGVIILLGISHILTSLYGPTPDSVFDLMNRATLYASAFLLTVYAGFLFARPGTRKQTGSPGPIAPGLASWDKRKLPQLRLAAWLSLGCSYLGCVILAAIFGGIRSIVAEPMAVIESRGAFWPFVLVWASLWSFGVFYISYVKERKPRYLFALLLTLPTMLFEFLAGGTKMAVILPVVCFLILRHYLVRRLSWKFIPTLAGFTLLIFAVGYAYRSSGFGSGDFAAGVADYRENKSVIFQTFLGRFYGTDSFMVVLDAADQSYPLQWGATMADLLYFYIPRALWPGKPESYSLAFGREFLSAIPHAEGTFFTPTLPGELYLNFGVVGVLAGGLLMGFLLRKFYLKLFLSPDRGVEQLLVYAAAMPLVALVLSGPISSTVEFVLLRSACFAAFYWFAGKVLGATAKTGVHPMLPTSEQTV